MPKMDEFLLFQGPEPGGQTTVGPITSSSE
jgi:hypothetical protein